jgi:hypothetical protein
MARISAVFVPASSKHYWQELPYSVVPIPLIWGGIDAKVIAFHRQGLPAFTESRAERHAPIRSSLHSCAQVLRFKMSAIDQHSWQSWNSFQMDMPREKPDWHSTTGARTSQ